MDKQERHFDGVEQPSPPPKKTELGIQFFRKSPYDSIIALTIYLLSRSYSERKHFTINVFITY
jgi:hypothetical protein